MHIPAALLELLDDGIISDVLRPLKSGKEASVYVVVMGGETCAAKVYKEVQHRTFRQRQDYIEGRQAADSRAQRAMDKGSRFGRQQRESAWHQAEADALRHLVAAGVRLPHPRLCHQGVVVMDLIVDASGQPAPQLAHVRLQREEAIRYHGVLLQQIVRMLCAGRIHGDLSEYNILMAADGPMIIDLPQVIDAQRNSAAKRLLARDVANVTRFLARTAPELRRGDHATEMWLLHERGLLTPASVLTGRVSEARRTVDVEIVLREIEAAKREAEKREQVEAWRRERKNAHPPGSAR
jgi:RIO kinase 1